MEPGLSREELITTNLRFAVSVAKRYVYTGIPLEDLIQYANMGLCRAADSYDPTKGFKFITYAVWWIRQTILANLRVGLISLPNNQWRELNNERAELAKKSQEDEFLYDSYMPRKICFEEWMMGSHEDDHGTIYTFDQMISVLNEKEKDIIRKRYIDGRSRLDIAIEMGCTKENVRSLESRALRKLKSVLKNKDL